MTYSGLKVWDADGRTIPARMVAAAGDSLRLEIEESAARYPLTVDPIAQQAYLKAGNNGALPNDQFGYAVAVSGDTVVIGDPFENGSDTGVNPLSDESAPALQTIHASLLP